MTFSGLIDCIRVVLISKCQILNQLEYVTVQKNLRKNIFQWLEMCTACLSQVDNRSYYGSELH